MIILYFLYAFLMIPLGLLCYVAVRISNKFSRKGILFIPLIIAIVGNFFLYEYGLYIEEIERNIPDDDSTPQPFWGNGSIPVIQILITIPLSIFTGVVTIFTLVRRISKER